MSVVQRSVLSGIISMERNEWNTETYLDKNRIFSVNSLHSRRLEFNTRHPAEANSSLIG